MRPTGNIPRVRKFFQQNPEEELTNRDIALKFGLTQKQVSNILHDMSITGELVVERVRVARWHGGKRG